jgi:hypothetical protein
MKLDDLLPSTAQMQLTHPTKGKLPIFLTLVGQDSKQWLDASARIAKNYMTGDQKNVEVERRLHEAAELVASAIIGWSDEEAFGKYSPERAVELMSNPGLRWIREEVERFMLDRSNFFPTESGKPEGVVSAQD